MLSYECLIVLPLCIIGEELCPDVTHHGFLAVVSFYPTSTIYMSRWYHLIPEGKALNVTSQLVTNSVSCTCVTVLTFQLFWNLFTD